MKTILVLTDFSISADYTAQYALALAQQVKANLLVCNIYAAAQEQDTAETNRRPFPTDKENSINDLGAVVAHLKTRLDMQKDDVSYRPEIEQCSMAGLAGDDLSAMISGRNVILALISAHTRDNFVNFLRIDNTWAFIDHASFPVLVIPYQVRFKPFKNIVLANMIMEPGEAENIKMFFDQLPFHISYHHHSPQSRPDTAGKIDLVVVIHHQRTFFQKLFKGSMTRKLATSSNKPLLVFPGSYIKETAGPVLA